MREYRNDNSRARGFEYARTTTSSGGSAHDDRATQPDPEVVVRQKLADAERSLATIAAVYLPKLEAAQPTEDDARPARERRTAYDDARKLAEAQLASAATMRASAVEYAKEHRVDATAALEAFDAQVAGAKQALTAAPPAPPRHEVVPLEDEIAAALASPRGPERNTALLYLFSQLDRASARVLKRRLKTPDAEDKLAQAFGSVVDARADLFGILDGTKKVRIDPRQVRLPSVSASAAIDDTRGTRDPDGATARADGSAIDKPPEYEENRATIDDSPEARTEREARRQPDAIESTRGTRNPNGAAERADGSAIDKPPEYDEHRVTIDDSPDARAEREARRQPDAIDDTRGTRNPDGAAERADGSAIDRPAEYEETRATIDDGNRLDEDEDDAPAAPADPARAKRRKKRPATKKATTPKQDTDEEVVSEPVEGTTPPTGGGMGDLRRVEGGLAMPNAIASEPQLRSLLSQEVAPNDVPGLQARKHGLVQLLRAIPDRERDIVAARMRADGDILGELVDALDPNTRAAAFKAIDGRVVPAAMPADSVEWAAFVEAVTPDRFLTKPDELVVDDLWKKDLPVVLTVLPGYGPPHPGPGAELHVKVSDRAGTVTHREVVTWYAGTAQVFGPVIFTLGAIGRHELVIDLVADGLVRKRITRAVVVRQAKSQDVVGTLSRNQARTAAATMSDAEVSGQAHAIREQIGAKEQPGADLAGDEEYQRLRGVLAELEWQATQRAEDGEPLDTGKADYDHTGTQDDYSGEPKPGIRTVDWTNRAALRACLEDLVAERGWNGARQMLEVDIHSDVNAPAAAGYREMLAELDVLEAEHGGKVHPGERPEAVAFADDAQAIGLALLDKSQAQIEAELQRYGIENTGLRDMGKDMYAAGGDDAQMAELQGLADEARRLGQMKTTLDRYVREVEGRQKTNDHIHDDDPASPEKIEALALTYMVQLQLAIEKYPSIMLFLQPGSNPNMYSIDEPARIGDASMVGPAVGYELGEKLKDIAAARDRLGNPREALGLPKVVALTKAHRHIVPGSLEARIIDDSVASWKEPDWTDQLFWVFQLALLAGLVIVSGGAAAPAAGAAAAAGTASTAAAAAIAAAEVAMLAMDIYLVYDQFRDYARLETFNNTSIDQAEALLEDLPSGFTVLLGALLVPVGGAGAHKAIANYAAAKEAAAAGKALQAAIRDAAGDLAHPQVIALSEPVRKLANDVLGPERAATFMDEITRAMGASARSAGRQIAKGVTLADVDLVELARRVGAGRIVRSEDPSIGVHVVYANEQGRLAIPEIIAREDVDVGLVLDHAQTVGVVKQWNAQAAKYRQAMDEVAGRAPTSPAGGAVDDAGDVPLSGMDEAGEEVAKHERMLRDRIARLADELNAGDVDAVGRLSDDMLALEGDYLYWRQILESGEHPPQGFVGGGKSPLDTTKEAIGNGYPGPPELPKGYFYRRWTRRTDDPTRPEYQVVRGSGANPSGPGYRAVRKGESWQLERTDTAGKTPHVYDDLTQSSEAILDDLLSRSDSLGRYRPMMEKLEVLRGLPEGHYRRRMERIVLDERRSARQASDVLDADTLRHAIKSELREDVLTYLDELSDADSYMELRRFTDDLNNSDLGNLAEDWYARRFASKGEQHAKASKEALAKGTPPIEIERNRFIDNLGPDGTATEIKSITGELDRREIKQLEDNVKMLEGGAKIGKDGRRMERLRYVFTRPEGLRENLDIMEDLLKSLGDRFSCEVFLDDGTKITIDSVKKLRAAKASL
jgi:hypothetical protein